MKKLFVFAMSSVFVLNLMAATPSELANKAFEIRKEASFSYDKVKKECMEFRNLMRNEMYSKSPEEKATFQNEFKQALGKQIATLSDEEKAKFDPKICKNFVDKPMNKGSKHGKHGSKYSHEFCKYENCPMQESQTNSKHPMRDF